MTTKQVGLFSTHKWHYQWLSDLTHQKPNISNGINVRKSPIVPKDFLKPTDKWKRVVNPIGWHGLRSTYIGDCL
jgi:hypothetical protein